MRAVIALIILVASSIIVSAAPPPPVLSKPLTEATLRELNEVQLRLLRQTIQACRVARPPLKGKVMPDERDPCVIAGTDRAIADKNDPDLKAFHEALPVTERYDENRPTTVWMKWVQPGAPG